MREVVEKIVISYKVNSMHYAIRPTSVELIVKRIHMSTLKFNSCKNFDCIQALLNLEPGSAHIIIEHTCTHLQVTVKVHYVNSVL